MDYQAYCPYFCSVVAGRIGIPHLSQTPKANFYTKAQQHYLISLGKEVALLSFYSFCARGSAHCEFVLALLLQNPWAQKYLLN